MNQVAIPAPVALRNICSVAIPTVMYIVDQLERTDVKQLVVSGCLTIAGLIERQERNPMDREEFVRFFRTESAAPRAIMGKTSPLSKRHTFMLGMLGVYVTLCTAMCTVAVGYTVGVKLIRIFM